MNLMMRYYVIFFLFFILGCGGNEQTKPLKQVEISQEAKQLNISFYHFDDDLFALDFSQADSATQLLYQKYGSFYCDFIESDLRLAPCHDPQVGNLLRPFVENKDILEARAEIKRQFTPEQFARLDESLSDALRKWNHYFPDSLVPRVIYYQSAWNTQVAATDSTIGISLDCYLGKKNPITQQLPPELFPNYMKANMESEYLVADAIKGWIAFKSRHLYKPKDLLTEMVFYGKMMYLSEALMPDLPDSTLMSWSTAQWQWAEKNEWNVWKTIANEKVMFQTKPFEINKWFNDGPFTGAQGVPQQSPPQLGVWFGWKIVRQYMQAHPEITPQQLWIESDARKILSSYKPNRN